MFVGCAYAARLLLLIPIRPNPSAGGCPRSGASAIAFYFALANCRIGRIGSNSIL